MKKIAILLFVCAGITGAANAQIQFSAGPGAGFNYAVHTSSDDETISRFGVLLTSQFDIQFSRLLGLLVWVDFYSGMSAGQNVEGLSGEYQISYLHLSPTLKFCLPGSPFYLFGGPGAGFRTKGRMKVSYEGLSMEEDIPDMNIRFDARFGAGYDIFLSKKITLSPFVAFNAGLNNVAADTDWKIHALQAGLVLRYNAF
ncbi:MAG: porin family protein [Tannerella sp.]|jgi:hypothetical protein|nr:porin family protein [Tannerella sp.]